MKTTILVIVALVLSGCSTILDHSTDGPIDPDPTRRTLGNWVDDQRLETIIQHNINSSSDALDKSNIHVDSFNGVVLLTGQANSSETRSSAGDIARAVPEVRQVHNEIEVQNNTSILSRTNDNYLASKVKLWLYADENIAGSRIEVICENSTIFLMGLISRADGDNAAEKAAQVGGVRRVVKVFEYID